jgi:hypothetical protein
MAREAHWRFENILFKRLFRFGRNPEATVLRRFHVIGIMRDWVWG